MRPLDDWMIVEKEEQTRDNKLIVPDSAKLNTAVDIGDIFVARVLGPKVEDRVAVGDRCLFYGMATVMALKLPSGKQVWVGKASDVAFKLEEGE